MVKYTLYIGLNDKKTKKQEIETIEAYKIVNNLLLNYVDGATIFTAYGLYKHENGEIVTEQTLRIELCMIARETVIDIIKQLKIILNQESVALTTENVTSELI